MERSFSAKLSEADYIRAASLLNLSPRPRWMNARLVAVLLVISFIAGPLVFLRQGSMSLLPFLPVGLFGGMLLNFAVLLPSRLRTLYSQQRDLHEPLLFHITAEALTLSNSYGQTRRPWSHFAKWSENEELIVLYLSDPQIVVLPKSQATDAETLAAIRRSLKNANVRQVRGGNVYSILALGLILWLGFLWTIELGLFHTAPSP